MIYTTTISIHMTQHASPDVLSRHRPLPLLVGFLAVVAALLVLGAGCKETSTIVVTSDSEEYVNVPGPSEGDAASTPAQPHSKDAAIGSGTSQYSIKLVTNEWPLHFEFPRSGWRIFEHPGGGLYFVPPDVNESLLFDMAIVRSPIAMVDTLQQAFDKYLAEPPYYGSSSSSDYQPTTVGGTIPALVHYGYYNLAFTYASGLYHITPAGLEGDTATMQQLLDEIRQSIVFE